MVVGFKIRQKNTRVSNDSENEKSGGGRGEEQDTLAINNDVLSCHTDSKVVESLQRQNTHLAGDVIAQTI